MSQVFRLSEGLIPKTPAPVLAPAREEPSSRLVSWFGVLGGDAKIDQASPGSCDASLKRWRK
jgi:hypothetical protein